MGELISVIIKISNFNMSKYFYFTVCLGVHLNIIGEAQPDWFIVVIGWYTFICSTKHVVQYKQLKCLLS